MTPAARSPATPGKTRQALIPDGLFGRTVVLWARFGVPWGHGWHLWVVIWAPVGPMKALTRRALLVGTFWGDGLAEKGLKKAWRAQTVFTHVYEGS